MFSLCRFGTILSSRAVICGSCVQKTLKSRFLFTVVSPNSSSGSSDSSEKVKPTKNPKKTKKYKRVKPSEALLISVGKTLGPQFLDKYSTYPDDINKSVEELLPHQCRKVTVNIPTALYLVDTAVAKEFVRLVKEEEGPELADKSGAVVEFNPGLGILTKELFSTFGFNRITGFEDSGKFVQFLTTEIDWGTGNKLVVLEKGFSEFPKLHYADKVDNGNRISSLLTQIKVDKPKTNLAIFGAIPHLSSINFLIRYFATSRIFYSDEWDWTDTVYYVALGSKPFWVITSTPTSGLFAYRPTSVIFQLFFKIKILGELPRSSWIPWANESTEGKSNKFKLRNAYDPDIVHLVKIETNRDVVARVGQDQLVHFWYFVRQHLFSRKNAIIVELEQWIPGCGARLIRKGFTIYTQFGELNAEQILELYLEFVSWPEFPESSFISAVEKFQARLDLQDDEAPL